MKEILLSIGVIAGALALSGAAVFVARDGATFVPPPEAAAEEFTRELSQKRYAIAWRHMSSAARQRDSEAQLRARFEPVLAELGKINHVEADEVASSGDTATATSSIDGSRHDVVLTLALRRENGLWMVEQWEVGGRVE